MTKTLRFALAAPLALALAACGSGAEETGEIKGDAIAAIPAPAGTEWRSTAVMTDDGGVLVGNPDAPSARACPAPSLAPRSGTRSTGSTPPP